MKTYLQWFVTFPIPKEYEVTSFSTWLAKAAWDASALNSEAEISLLKSENERLSVSLENLKNLYLELSRIHKVKTEKLSVARSALEEIAWMHRPTDQINEARGALDKIKGE